ncbi:hypothetical protein J4480_00940 [Candidatus Woesearchaeota archaeon]|nr:hypothetical protein [Candidatus Woesearchaeota archaeon]
MKSKTFDVKAFWKEMKELFPDIDLNSIKEDSGQWAITKPIILKGFHNEGIPDAEVILLAEAWLERMKENFKQPIKDGFTFFQPRKDDDDGTDDK